MWDRQKLEDKGPRGPNVGRGRYRKTAVYVNKGGISRVGGAEELVEKELRAIRIPFRSELVKVGADDEDI